MVFPAEVWIGCYERVMADSIAKQVNATIQAVIASSQLQAACGSLQLDQQALQSGDVKCIEKK